MGASIESNFRYFIEHQTELYALYPNKYLVIMDENVVFAGDSVSDALDYTLNNKLIPGTFLIQQCEEGEDAYTQTFFSRAIFA